jgi:hypothetical protein
MKQPHALETKRTVLVALSVVLGFLAGGGLFLAADAVGAEKRSGSAESSSQSSRESSNPQERIERKLDKILDTQIRATVN